MAVVLALPIPLLLTQAGPVGAQGASEGAEGLRVIGQMPRPVDNLGRPMTVDKTRSLGIMATSGNNAVMHLLDLERMIPLAERSAGIIHGYTPESALAIDEARERLYVATGYPSTVTAASTPCDRSPGVPVFDYRAGANGRRGLGFDEIAPLPCTGPPAASVQFSSLTMAYDHESERLYVNGVPASERWRFQPSVQPPVASLAGGTFEEDRGQPLLLRQLRIEGDGLKNADPNKTMSKPILEWEIDLRLAGCGRRQHEHSTVFQGFVARLNNEVLAYCWDARPYRGLQAGQQGYLVRIPLEKDPVSGEMRPVPRSGAATPDPTGPPQSITNYVSRRIPTLPGDVTPILDRETGRVMLVTTNRTNGNAVWVLDPQAERFVGVITGGYSDEQTGNSAVGFDSDRGRVYVLTKNGILIAPIRGTPLPAGLIYPVLANESGVKNFVSSSHISVLPALRRLYVAQGNTFTVLEDHVPDPPVVEPIDPDTLTTQIKEAGGKTSSSTSGQAVASGAHIVNAGGLARLVGQNDPSCVFSPPNIQSKQAGEAQDPIPDWEFAPALFGACLPDMTVSPGHREASAAISELEAGSGTGSTARSSAFAFASTDTGTDADVRKAGSCGVDAPDRADRWGRRWPFPDNAALTGNANGEEAGSNALIARRGGPPRADGSREADKKPYEDEYNAQRDAFWAGWEDQRHDGQEDYKAACDGFQDGFAEGSAESPTGAVDLRTGTRGPDGRGFPVPSAACGDFGGAPSSQTWPEEASDRPQAGYPTSRAACDASVPRGDGNATIGALSFPSAADPQISVARLTSRVSSVRTTNEGQVTVAFASAAGVQIGPLGIAEIRSLAITKAFGRKGTTSANLVRQFCGLTLAGQEQEGCVDAESPEVEQLLDEVSAALVHKVQLAVPEAETQQTRGGYQAVVTKHPGQRGADQTVNDDDSHTVSALQVTVYNDGPRGRSRVIFQLAGVHAESRYGVIPLPNFTPPGPEEPPESPPAAPPPAPPTEPVGEPEGPIAGPTPGPSTPPSLFEDVIIEEVVRTNAGSPVRPVLTSPPAGGPLERIVRVPVQALRDAINLLVQHPREFALLFVMFALLSAPLYMGLRRRAFARELAMS